jgi:hypothetical protein
MNNKLTICFAVIGLSIGLTVGAAYTHVPADRTFLAFQWPDDHLPTIDGNLSEWDIVPDAYKLTLDNLQELLYNRAADKSDFDLIRAYVGYNANTDLLYLASEVFDNLHQRTNTDPGQCNCLDDDIELWVDADHGGDPFGGYLSANPTPEETKRGSNALIQWYAIAVPPVGGRVVHGGNGDWMIAPPYMDIKWSFTGEENGESIYRVEVYLTPWDDLDWHGPGSSIIHDLKEGEIIGLNTIWSDYDYETTETGGKKYRAYRMTGAAGQGESASDYLLAPIEGDLFPTAVEAQTWGRIKTRFVN